mmetsp:Transcript_68356/g.163149  ORF Transcript_68356/g.163149 Transcript_68356/m.163149 type:complete len:211 (-) Transcript_68356:453-1085(-)
MHEGQRAHPRRVGAIRRRDPRGGGGVLHTHAHAPVDVLAPRVHGVPLRRRAHDLLRGAHGRDGARRRAGEAWRGAAHAHVVRVGAPRGDPPGVARGHALFEETLRPLARHPTHPDLPDALPRGGPWYGSGRERPDDWGAGARADDGVPDPARVGEPELPAGDARVELVEPRVANRTPGSRVEHFEPPAAVRIGVDETEGVRVGAACACVF